MSVRYQSDQDTQIRPACVDIWTPKHTTIPLQHPHVYIYCYEISLLLKFVSLVVLTILITNVIATS
ncbi:MAG: hypothetical protein WCE93_12650, partial [Nitrososphaeraceae archaeon]